MEHQRARICEFFVSREFGQWVAVPLSQGGGATKRRTIRCGSCGAPLSGEDLNMGHYCDDRGGNELDD